MATTKMRHSKYKNTGILYELLIRQVTADVIDGTNNSKSVDIIKMFFVPEHSELKKELLLYRAIIEEDISGNTDKISYFLDRVTEVRKNLDSKRLHKERYNLIKEIKNRYNITEFFKSRLTNYRIYAAIYKLFEGIDNAKCSPTDLTEARYSLIEYLSRNNGKNITDSERIIEDYKKQDKDVRLLSYKLLIDKYNTKYGSLNDHQRNLLNKYINNISNTNSLKEYMMNEVDRLKKSLQSLLDGVNEKIIRIKVTEAIKHLPDVVKGSTVKDDQVVSLLKFYELKGELESALRY